jgi:hypothetical protein
VKFFFDIPVVIYRFCQLGIDEFSRCENKKVHSLVKKLKINVKMHGEHNVKGKNVLMR